MSETEKSDVEYILAAAMAFVGKPYIWGGSGPDGFDCSGFVREMLKVADVAPKSDITAQGIYDWLKSQGATREVGQGAVAFYGTDEKHITHVMMLISTNWTIGATGGDHTTTTLQAASQAGAMVTVRRLQYRPDLVAILMPQYAKR